jgi:hypothetical protein
MDLRPPLRRRARGAPSRPRSWFRGAALAIVAALCAGVPAGCGDTLQDNPIPHNILEGMLVAPFPVYWLGDHFGKLEITEAKRDPSGAFTVQYGNCLQGGQGTCTPPLRVITSPDNSFLPGGAKRLRSSPLRGVSALLTDAGRTIAIPTGGVVVDIFAKDAATAMTAAQQIVAINQPASPGQPLPARLPDTGFGSTPLPSQLPSTVRPPD